MNQDKKILDINNLNVFYGDLQALHDISFHVRRGSITSIIGSNGAGKSTLLNTIMGINKPKSGDINLNGEKINGLQTNKIIARGVSMAPEGSLVFQDLTVKENLLMGAYLPVARKVREETLGKVYELFPILKEKEDQQATFLSGGQRQMLAIARAIMTKPQIILCDEISLGLAPVVVKDIFKKIEDINKEDGTTFVLVEQDVKRSLRHSDYCFVIVKGKIVMEGVSSEFDEAEIMDAFLGMS
ncbi:ABC transporter ATP-binding protein [Christensenellaceae bacterium OttesenSCG-928-K19]|nr:ABC transporter ATP-binding protein [Christensenellaceae bacterium OttesenSCG-928-K19]